jgi:alpha-galactosidase
MNDGEKLYSGSALMNAGIPINREVPEYSAFQFNIQKKK